MKDNLAAFVLGAVVGISIFLGVRNFIHIGPAIAGAQDPGELMQLALSQMALGDFPQAQNNLILASVLDHDNPVILKTLGDAVVMNGIPAQAIGYYERAIILDKADPGIWHGLAEALEVTDQPERSRVAKAEAARLEGLQSASREENP